MVTDASHEIEIRGAPAIDGLRFRTFRGAEDIPAMHAVHRASNLADETEDVITLEAMTSDYANLTNCDPSRDVVLIEVGGELVGYSRRYWTLLNEGGRAYESFAFLHPAWRRRRIGTALLPYNEEGLRAIAAEHPDDGPKWLTSGAVETQAGTHALLRNAGYEPIRYGYDMVRPTLDEIPDVPMPEGLEVRPAERGQYRAIWEANNEAFRDHWGEHDESEASYQRFLDWPEAEPELWRVAWDGDQVAGLVLNSVDHAGNEQFGRQRGWLDSVSVRRPWRRRGLARALIARSLAAFRERGMTSAGLGVDTENPTGALQLYESLGFAPERRYTAYRKPL